MGSLLSFRYPADVRIVLVFLFLTGCAGGFVRPRPSLDAQAAAGNAVWAAIQPLCGKAFEGRLVEGTEPSDAAIGRERLVMHVRACSDSEIRIPFHVGADHSRTWILTRTEDVVRLRHEHRHEDGTEDDVSGYGGEARGPAIDDLTIDFPADPYTASLLPAAASNIWTIAVDPGQTFTYALRREAQGRRFRVEFDLGAPVRLHD